MKYFFLKKPDLYNYDRFGSSMLNISAESVKLDADSQDFIKSTYTIRLVVRGEETENRLDFLLYTETGAISYMAKMIPELQSIFSQFKMPDHRWYQAEAGYDLEFIKRMKKFFKIDYSKYDLNEKREYRILQFLNQRRSDLEFNQIVFKLNDYDTFKPIEGLLLGKTIKDLEEYKEVRKKEIKENNRYPEPTQYIYRKNYDILWGGTHIVFNEKVKAALEASNLINYENGLEFAEFTDYEIVMLGE